MTRRGIRKGFLTPADVAPWRSVGATLREAVAWERRGLTAEDADRWARVATSFAEVDSWFSLGVDDPERARRWRIAAPDITSARRWLRHEIDPRVVGIAERRDWSHPRRLRRATMRLSRALGASDEDFDALLSIAAHSGPEGLSGLRRRRRARNKPAELTVGDVLAWHAAGPTR